MQCYRQNAHLTLEYMSIIQRVLFRWFPKFVEIDTCEEQQIGCSCWVGFSPQCHYFYIFILSHPVLIYFFSGFIVNVKVNRNSPIKTRSINFPSPALLESNAGNQRTGFMCVSHFGKV